MSRPSRRRFAATDFSETVRRSVPPGQALPEHLHDWDVHGRVLRGRFRVDGLEGTQDCGPGQVFTLPAGQPHTEAAGPDGAELLIGRRHGPSG
jgi:quercetin dioxygenase-like cupin family protein